MSSENAQSEQLARAGRTHRQTLAIDVFTAARERMAYVYDNFDTVVVSWSGGKDSTVCLELAREAAAAAGKLPVKVLFLDEEVIYPETLDLIGRHRHDPDIEFYWACVPSIYRNACSEKEPNFIPWDPTKRELWTHVPPPDAIWPAGFGADGLPRMSKWRVPPSIVKRLVYELFGRFPDRYGRVASVVGLRTQESFNRFTGVLKSGGFITGERKNVWDVRPIYDWYAGDVWLAIKENGWDYNRAYEKLWRAGGQPKTTRVAPLFHAEAMSNLPIVMRFWPQWWPLVRRRVRGAHAVAIHGGTLHAIERFGSETWKDAAERYLNSLGDAQDRQHLYQYVQEVLGNHYKNSSIELPDEKNCRCCGASWKKIARAVARGDRQGRMLRLQSSNGWKKQE